MANEDEGPGNGVKVPEWREWIHVAVAVATFLLAVVSFWTTARISGLEAYLRSEISRRNSDLDALAKQSAGMAQLASERERQLARLDSATSEIIASSLSAQAQLAERQGELTQVHSEVSEARHRLSVTQASQQRLEEDFTKQEKAFDLFRRQKAYDQTMLTFSWFGLDEKIPSGVDVVQMIRRMAHLGQSTDNTLYPYLSEIDEKFLRVCPGFDERQPSIDVVKPKPVPYEKGSKEFAIWSKELDEYYDGLIAGHSEMRKAASHCVCNSLSTRTVAAKEICPSLDL